MQDSIFSVSKSKVLLAPIALFLILGFFWFYIYRLPLEESDLYREIWAAIYQFMAILGVIISIFILRRWGVKSLLGQGVLAFSVGLFLQSFGQSAYSYYIYFKHIEVPYPSVGDIGFFGSVLAYTWAVVVLARVVGADFSFKISTNKVRSLLISIFILVASYWFFLRGYEFDWSQPVRVFLDFGYPLGQAVYLSIAIGAFLVSQSFLGGMLRRPILFLLFALVFQYISDFMFLYQYSNGTWHVGGLNDFMYFISYFLMTIALIFLDNTFSKIRMDLSGTQPGPTKQGANIDNVSSILAKIILAIITRQEKVTGQIAWEEAKKVPGLRVVDQKEGKLVISGDTRGVIDSLVARYQSLFGDLAVLVSKDAARHLLADLPATEVPSSLK